VYCLVKFHGVSSFMKTKSQPDFTALWNLLISVSRSSGNERLRSTLMNHHTKKEYICRKLGVVSDMDVKRYQNARKV